MILFELTAQSEKHPIYQNLERANNSRHCDFLRSVTLAAFEADRRLLSQTVIKALNYHAIACLHGNAGEYRLVPVSVGTYRPPDHYRVPSLMDDFINKVNRNWKKFDPFSLAAYVLWRWNWIHPFINGNGRTARAASYMVFCLKIGEWIRTPAITPELLREPENRRVLVKTLCAIDKSPDMENPDLSKLVDLLARMLQLQLSSANADQR